MHVRATSAPLRPPTRGRCALLFSLWSLVFGFWCFAPQQHNMVGPEALPSGFRRAAWALPKCLKKLVPTRKHRCARGTQLPQPEAVKKRISLDSIAVPEAPKKRISLDSIAVPEAPTSGFRRTASPCRKPSKCGFRRAASPCRKPSESGFRNTASPCRKPPTCGFRRAALPCRKPPKCGFRALEAGKWFPGGTPWEGPEGTEDPPP